MNQPPTPPNPIILAPVPILGLGLASLINPSGKGQNDAYKKSESFLQPREK
jgi:hypothetical protein